MASKVHKKITFKKLRLVLYPFYILLFVACGMEQEPAFKLDRSSENAVIYLDQNSDALIKWAAKDFAANLEQMLGKKIEVKSIEAYDSMNPGIYIARFDDPVLKGLPAEYTTPLQDKWEHFSIKQNFKSLIIAGSDIRGTVFGVFDVAERMGISPWQWWADLPPLKKEKIELFLPANGMVQGPSVQYRGIFLNDEDWGLQPWAAQTFEPETGDIGPRTYEKIFQLLLRLKANTIWPAMHPSTKGFYTIPGNREMAEQYHIVVGTSHAEPMLRNNVDEWDKKTRGDFNYFTNKTSVQKYWQERISEVRHGDNIISMGMRGVHDSGMEGGATIEEKKKMLETIIDDQRQMLAATFKQSAEEIPQVFIPYKEVLELYDQGLKVPDDITLMWTDDNYGYIRRLSSEEENRRKGGSGIYYHLSYWGRPHDYLWLSTTQPGLIWFEMSRAYENGARKIWIANVGDLKPAEYNMEFFLDLAWDVTSISESSIKGHLQQWCSREFGLKNGKKIASVMNEYYRLAFLRKPEFMGWSRTEPSTKTTISEFSTSANNNELQRRLDQYDDLYRQSESIKENIPNERRDAYFQLVEYPVKGAALMNRKFLYAHESFMAREKNKQEEMELAAQNAYSEIVALTTEYNEKISNGKWNKIMSMNPRNLAAYQMPDYQKQHADATDKFPDETNRITAPLFIQANEFVHTGNRDNYQWRSVDGLGYSASAMTLFPLTNHTFNNDLPYLEYQFRIGEPGEYQLEIRLLPTHSNNSDFTILVEKDGGKLATYAINTKGRSEAWKVNVLRNAAVIQHDFTVTKAGKQSIKIYANQTGIVMDQLAVCPKGAPAFYEIPLLRKQ